MLPVHLQQTNQPHGSDQQHSSPLQAFKDVETIPMTFPKKVLLTLTPKERVKFARGAHGVIMFPAGIHEVPRELAGHWFLKANRVTPYTPPEAA